MSIATFDKLLDLFGRSLTFQGTRMRESVLLEERLSVTLRYKETSVLFLIHIIFVIVLSGTDKNSEYSLFIAVLSSKYIKIRMIDSIIHPT